MEEKNVIKISLSTVLLIIAIIIIIIMAGFIYTGHLQKKNTDVEVGELKNKVSSLETELSEKENVIIVEKETVKPSQPQNTASANSSNENKTSQVKQNTIKTLKGTYEASTKAPSGEMATVSLSLNEDGTFIYYYVAGYEVNYEGYYVVDENSIILHVILDCGNDIGATLTEKKINLKINDDNSLTDVDELKLTLKKSSENACDVNLTESIKTRLNQKVLSY